LSYGLALSEGQILVLDGIAYEITKAQRLIDKETITLTALQTAAVNDLKANLTPDNTQIYFLEDLDFVGPTRNTLQYPKGVPLFTPHGIYVPIEENQTPYTINVFIKPATYPTLVSDNLVNATISQDIFFYGWIYWISAPLTADQVAAAQAAGTRVLEVTNK
jgi:hypothetical protein